MVMQRMFFATSFIKVMILGILAICELNAMDNVGQDVPHNLRQLVKAIKALDFAETGELASQVNAEKLSQEVDGATAIEHAGGIDVYESLDLARITSLFIEAVSELTLGATPRSTFDGEYFKSLLQGIRVDNQKVWNESQTDNFHKMLMLLQKKIAERQERQKNILKLLIERGASCKCDLGKPGIIRLWSNLAAWLGKNEIEIDLIMKLLRSIAKDEPEALEGLYFYLTLSINNSNRKQDEKELDGMKAIQAKLVEFLGEITDFTSKVHKGTLLSEKSSNLLIAALTGSSNRIETIVTCELS